MFRRSYFLKNLVPEPYRSAIPYVTPYNRNRKESTMLKCCNLTKEYQINDQKTFLALDHVSLSIQRGEFVAIVGKSGSGKSTLMNLFGLIDTQTSGEIWLNGVCVSSLSEKEQAKIRNQSIGYIFQAFHLEPFYSVARNVAMPLYIKGVPVSQHCSLITAALEQVGMADRMQQSVRDLSGGEKQRVCIARAIVNDPELILADEPCGNLDTENSRIVMSMLKEQQAKGKTVVLITHSESEAAQADRRIFLRDGKVVNYDAV